MRKVFWCGCLVAAVAAALVYVVADYATEHPDSFTGRCAAGLYRAVTDYNPVLLVSHATAGRIYDAVQEKVSCCDEERPVCPAASEECEAPATPEPVEPVEVIDLTQPPATPGAGEEESGIRAGSPAGPVTPETVPPLPIQERNAAVPTPASPEVPATMPYAEDSEKGAESLKDYWQDLFREATETLKAEPKPGAGEESESINEGKAPDCREVPDYHHPYPECPHAGSYCPYTGRTYPPEESATPAGEEESEPKAPPAKPDRLRKKKAGDKKPAEPKPQTGSLETPSRTEVETLEFRPTDARDGDFDRKPI
jgi:hypothetical protein